MIAYAKQMSLWPLLGETLAGVFSTWLLPIAVSAVLEVNLLQISGTASFLLSDSVKTELLMLCGVEISFYLQLSRQDSGLHRRA